MRDRDLMRVAAARFISRAGSEATFFVGIWGMAAYTFHARPAQIAILMLAFSIASIAGSLVAGVLVDRYDPRRMAIAAEVLFIPVALAFIAVRSMTQLTVLAALLGLTGAPLLTAAASLAPFIRTGRERLDTANAWIEGAGSLSFVAGPAIGALLVTWLPITSVFVFDAATSFVAVVILAGVRLEGWARPDRGGRALAEMREGFRRTYGDRALRFYLFVGTATWMGFGAFAALEPLFYRDVVHTGVQAIGWANTVFGLGLLFGAWLLPRSPRRLVSARGLTVVAMLVGLGAVLYVGTADLRVIFSGALVWGAVIGFMDPLLRTLVQAASPPDLVGRIAGASQVHRHAGELLPLAFAPALAAAFGVQATLIGGGVALAIVVGAGFLEAVSVDSTRKVPAAPAQGFAPGDEPLSPNP